MAVMVCVVRGAWLSLAVMTMWRSASLAWSSSEQNTRINTIPIWPMPASVEYGMNEHYTLAVPKDLAVAVVGNYPDSTSILNSGISRFRNTIHLLHHQIEMLEDELTGKAAGTLSFLRALCVSVESGDDQGEASLYPEKGTETFLSIVGLIEDRINLYDGGTHERGNLTRNHLISGEQVIDLNIEPGDRFYADLCVMASTAAYDNKLVIRNRVTEHWKMHFVEFFDFWNDHLQKKSTQSFIFCDKEVDAQLVVIAFTGTQAFAADDWETNFDFSWYQFNHIGKVHLGFLEALGLANCSKKTEMFTHHTSYVPPLDIDKEDPDKALAYYVLSIPDQVKTLFLQMSMVGD